MNTFVSTLNGRSYRVRDAARVPDRRLQTLYIKHGLRPIDLYTSIDNDGRDIIVMLFDRNESAELYQKWIDRTLR